MQQISIVLCTYNGEQFIDEQIVSILNQTYANFELIISDDSSFDTTPIKLKKWAERDKRIKLFFQQKNIGFNASFEFVLRRSSNDIIAISDQDDVWLPAKLEKMMRYWHPSCPMIHCDSRRFTDNISKLVYRSKNYTRFSGKDSKKLFFFNSINGHAMMIKRSLLEKILPFEKEIYYDWWTAFVGSCNGGVDYLNEVLVYQRVHEGNISIKEIRKDIFLKNRDSVRQHITKFITAPNISLQDKQLGLRFVKYLSSLCRFKNRIYLFFTMVKLRKTLFYYERKPLNFLSHIKLSIKWAFS